MNQLINFQTLLLLLKHQTSINNSAVASDACPHKGEDPGTYYASIFYKAQ